MSSHGATERRRCQQVDCERQGTHEEIWRIDDAQVRVVLCDEHTFPAPATRLVSAERWSTRTKT